MSKVLNALRDIPCNCDECKYVFDKECPMMIVRKALKALEIIRNTDRLSLLLFIANCAKNKDEYQLLYEVLR